VGQRILRTSLIKMTDDIETKLGVNAAACDDKVLSSSSNSSREQTEVLRVCEREKRHRLRSMYLQKCGQSC